MLSTRLRRPSPAHPSGWTHRDLLATIAALGVAGALLMPVISRGDELSNAEHCRTHLKQLTYAFEHYRADHDGKYPRPAMGNVEGLDEQQKQAKLWFNAVDPYLLESTPDEPADPDEASEKALETIAALKQDPIHSQWDAEQQQRNRTLKMNTYMRDDANQRYRAAAADLSQPNRTVLLVDGRAEDVHENDIISARRYDATEGLATPRHNDKANVAFADASVRAVDQPVRENLAAPGWYPESSDQQELVWRIFNDDD